MKTDFAAGFKNMYQANKNNTQMKLTEAFLVPFLLSTLNMF